MSQQREITQDHIDGMKEAFKIANILGVPVETTDKELSDLLATAKIIAPDKSREIQIDAINKTKEVVELNNQLAIADKSAKTLVESLQKLGINYLS